MNVATAPAGTLRATLERDFEDLAEVIGRIDRHLAEAEGPVLGYGLVRSREVGLDPLEGVFARGLRRLDKSGEYREDGALSSVAWVRQRCNLSGGAAAERVNVARQLEKLPQTEKALAAGHVGFQHVAAIARAAENVGTSTVQKEEATLLKAAQSMDPGRFANVAKAFEFRVNHEAALANANAAYSRRYLHLSEPTDGLVHVDGLLDAEGGATLKTALEALMPPPDRLDDRTAGQRRADALVDLARARLDRSTPGKVGGQRPHLVIRVTSAALDGVAEGPPAEMDGVGPIPIETARRHACDASITLISGRDEMNREAAEASPRIPPATRRALVERDRTCVFDRCNAPAAWCDGHHVIWTTMGGPTRLANLALLCRGHHRRVHEEGWKIARGEDGRWVTTPPLKRVPERSRSD